MSTNHPLLSTQIAISWGQHWAHLDPVGPRWAPCWPHEPCYQGILSRCQVGIFSFLWEECRIGISRCTTRVWSELDHSPQSYVPARALSGPPSPRVWVPVQRRSVSAGRTQAWWRGRGERERHQSQGWHLRNLAGTAAYNDGECHKEVWKLRCMSGMEKICNA